jgi:hypothetical protein
MKKIIVALRALVYCLTKLQSKKTHRARMVCTHGFYIRANREAGAYCEFGVLSFDEAEFLSFCQGIVNEYKMPSRSSVTLMVLGDGTSQTFFSTLIETNTSHFSFNFMQNPWGSPPLYLHLFLVSLCVLFLVSPLRSSSHPTLFHL